MELIDTQWDVNAEGNNTGNTAETELIDTQWDVNYISSAPGSSSALELIDTQWDVNTVNTININKSSRINRYIVGCKFRKLLDIKDQEQSELIDTQWDVNLHRDYSREHNIEN